MISGALEEIYMNQKKVNDEHLVLRPFPQVTIEGQEIRELWHRYRIDMISKSGVSIFLFGNKLDNGDIVDANGVYSEFEISKGNDNIIVPVGVTGYKAKEIWNEVKINFKEFYPNATSKLETLYESLNTEQDKDRLVDAIINFIKEAKKCTKDN